MFGWEFPPHISGGLGTACYGLTKGLAKLNEVDVIFVVPKAFGDEEPSAIQLIGANQIPVSQKEIQFEHPQQKIDYFELNPGRAILGIFEWHREVVCSGTRTSRPRT